MDNQPTIIPPISPENEGGDLLSSDVQQVAAQPQSAVQSRPPSSNIFYISQDFKLGRESFSVTDGQSLVCVAKRKIMAIKEHLDVYSDEAASQIVFSIQQTTMVTLNREYEVVAANGTKMGGFRLKGIQSMMNEHWEILDANNNPIGDIEQNMMSALAGRYAKIVPQTFVAKINGQQVCEYTEEMNIGMYFKMDIDFSSDTAAVYDRTLGIAGAILLSSRHMNTE
jgi:uncharacterized protein YxjI